MTIKDTENAPRVRQRMVEDCRIQFAAFSSEIEHYPGCFTTEERTLIHNLKRQLLALQIKLEG